MPLQLSKEPPAEQEIELPGGARMWVRPAEFFEHLEAEHDAVKLIAGLVTGQDAAMRASTLLGRQFRDADFTDRAWARAAEQSIMLIELGVRCITRWEGIVDDDGKPAEPKRENVALLLRDSDIAKRLGLALRTKVNLEVAEKNVSAASPDGAAAADTTTATNAAN